MKYDFCGWATKNNLKCSDGRTIRKDAFKHNDGQKVPLIWNHKYDEPFNVLGHAMLENKESGVYAYCTFNDTEAGKAAKMQVKHGDITSLSIHANKLKQNGGDVIHGDIKEVSLVVGGANPGARIESVLNHSSLSEDEEEAIIYTGNNITLLHSDEKSVPTEKENNKEEKEETIADIVETMTEKQKTAMYALVGSALEEGNSDEEEKEIESDKGGKEEMKHNIFDKESRESSKTLSHSDRESIIKMAKSNSVGSLRTALEIFDENSELKHGIDNIEQLFPEHKDMRTGAPELIAYDQTWVKNVMSKTHKSPFSRIRTRQIDIRNIDSLKAKGYKKTKEKKEMGNVKLVKRTTDPQTIYIKDALNRDDIIDITDFDVVEYQYKIMRQTLNEEIAMAILIGDGRDDGDEDKIEESHVRSILHDDELYTIHTTVDTDSMKEELQGSNTSVSFGENYIYAEAIVTSALYSREKYKGSGDLSFYCTPHLLNVMLLARDMNGRRIYNSKTDLAAALNVKEIITVEQFAGKTRTVDGKTKSLLGIFVNLKDYTLGSTKGGEITKFNQFDIDFNQEKYLIETRLSGALYRIKSAIVLEEDITVEG